MSGCFGSMLAFYAQFSIIVAFHNNVFSANSLFPFRLDRQAIELYGFCKQEVSSFSEPPVTHVCKYPVSRRLDRGALGEVWLAPPRTRYPLTIKTLAAHLVDRDKAFFDRFLQEARTAAIFLRQDFKVTVNRIYPLVTLLSFLLPPDVVLPSAGFLPLISAKLVLLYQ